VDYLPNSAAAPPITKFIFEPRRVTQRGFQFDRAPYRRL